MVAGSGLLDGISPSLDTRWICSGSGRSWFDTITVQYRVPSVFTKDCLPDFCETETEEVSVKTKMLHTVTLTDRCCIRLTVAIFDDYARIPAFEAYIKHPDHAQIEHSDMLFELARLAINDKLKEWAFDEGDLAVVYLYLKSGRVRLFIKNKWTKSTCSWTVPELKICHGMARSTRRL